MAGALFALLLAVQVADDSWPGRYTAAKHESLIPPGMRRDPGLLLRLAERAGGGRDTEEALHRALLWLARTQKRDGSWDAPDEARRVEITGLALLAFLSARYTSCAPTQCRPYYRGRLDSGRTDRPSTEGSETFHLTVRRGLRWLIDLQDSGGFIGARDDEGSLRGHCIAATALSEAYGWTNLPILRDPAERAIAAILAARSADGRWRDDSAEEETILNGRVAMALRSAALSEIRFPRASLEGLKTWRQESAKGEASSSRFAVDLIVGRILFTARLSEHRALTADQGTPYPPSWDGGHPDFQCWTWDTAALYFYDGPSGPLWRRWSSALKKELLEHQDASATALRGSWPPVHPDGSRGGRAQATALNALSLATSHEVLIFGYP